MKIIPLLAPVLRLLPPWWRVRIYNHLSKDPCQEGGHYGQIKHRRISPHGFEMPLNLDDWMDRLAYYLGCFYEIQITAVLSHLLVPGDVVLDVGANVGYVSLTASKLVGESGKVLSIEPNPVLVKRLTETIRVNRIRNIEVLATALSDTAGRATLRVDGHAGTGSLRSPASGGVDVPVVQGDSLLGSVKSQQRLLVKIDVEGYELNALKGLKDAINRPKTAFLVEVTPLWLKETGGSVEEMFGLFQSAGYHSYLPSVSALSRLSYRPLAGPLSNAFQYDVLFVRPNDQWLRGHDLVS